MLQYVIESKSSCRKSVNAGKFSVRGNVSGCAGHPAGVMEGEFDCLSSDKETSAVFYHDVKDTEVAESQECSGSFKMPQGHVLVFV